MDGQSQRAKAEAFAKLHDGPGILLLPNAWDLGSAVIMEEAGFPALATTSAGIAYAMGSADGERLGRDAMLDVVARIAERVSVPLSADLETGYGSTPDDVAETIRRAIAAGAVGANNEDGTIGGEAPLFEVELGAERIRAARQAADAAGMPFVVNARADCYLRLGEADAGEKFAETLRRADAYREAGADCIFVPGVADGRTIRQLAKEIDAPLNVLGAFSGTSVAPLKELEDMGVRRVSLGGSLSLAVLAMVRRAADELLSDGTFGYAPTAMTNAEANRLFG